MATPTGLKCAWCGEPSRDLCGGCLLVSYCDRKCQEKHRSAHRKGCGELRKIAMKLLEEIVADRSAVGADTGPSAPPKRKQDEPAEPRRAKRQETEREVAERGGDSAALAALESIRRPDDAARRLAFLSGLHPRLGRESVIARTDTPSSILKDIVEFEEGTDAIYVEVIRNMEIARLVGKDRISHLVAKSAKTGKIAFSMESPFLDRLCFARFVPFDYVFAWYGSYAHDKIQGFVVKAIDTRGKIWSNPVEAFPEHYGFTKKHFAILSEKNRVVRIFSDGYPISQPIDVGVPVGFGIHDMFGFMKWFVFVASCSNCPEPERRNLYFVDPFARNPTFESAIVTRDAGGFPEDISIKYPWKPCDSAEILLCTDDAAMEMKTARFTGIKDGKISFAVTAEKSTGTIGIFGGMFFNYKDRAIVVPIAKTARSVHVPRDVLFGAEQGKIKGYFPVFDATMGILWKNAKQNWWIYWVTRGNDGGVSVKKTPIRDYERDRGIDVFGIDKRLGLAGFVIYHAAPAVGGTVSIVDIRTEAVLRETNTEGFVDALSVKSRLV